MTTAKVAAGFVSFTEITRADEHDAYNRWHLFDHLPEQVPLPGIVGGQRWVLTPALRRTLVADAPLDRVHYVTLYLLAEPLTDTIDAFMALGAELHRLGRFHEHRVSHLAGPLRVAATTAAPHALVSPAAVPYRPNTGVHIRVERGGRPETDQVVGVPGVAGVWTFVGEAGLSPPALEPLTITWCWLDGDPGAVALDAPNGSPLFAATLDAIDPFGSFDWFDGASA